jgi:hypothetical protein
MELDRESLSSLRYFGNQSFTYGTLRPWVTSFHNWKVIFTRKTPANGEEWDMFDLFDWTSAGGVWNMAGWIAIIFAVTLTIEAVLDWRAKRPPLSRKTWTERGLDLMSLMLIMSIIFLPDNFEKAGLPPSLAFVVPLMLIAISTPFMLSKQRKASQNRSARPNPNAKPGEDAKWADQLGAEELKVNAKLLGAIIAFGILSIGLLMFLLPLIINGSAPPSVLGLFGMLALTSALLAFLTYAILGRWPGKVILEDSIVVQRPITEVWNTLQFRNTTDWWNPIVMGVEQLDVPGENYKMHYFCDDTCGQCGLPRDPDQSTRAALIEILEKREPSYFRVRARLVGTPSVEGLMSHEESMKWLEAIGPETTRVSSRNICVKPKMWLAVVLKLGAPCGEELRTLKARMEGLPASTIYSAAAARVAAHRRAETFCGCASGAPIEGKFIT